MYLPVSCAMPSLEDSGLSIGVCLPGSPSRSDTEGYAPVTLPMCWNTLGAGGGGDTVRVVADEEVGGTLLAERLADLAGLNG